MLIKLKLTQTFYYKNNFFISIPFMPTLFVRIIICEYVKWISRIENQQAQNKSLIDQSKWFFKTEIF